jgi:hypothetical protein
LPLVRWTAIHEQHGPVQKLVPSHETAGARGCRQGLELRYKTRGLGADADRHHRREFRQLTEDLDGAAFRSGGIEADGRVHIDRQ